MMTSDDDSMRYDKQEQQYLKKKKDADFDLTVPSSPPVSNKMLSHAKCSYIKCCCTQVSIQTTAEQRGRWILRF